MKPDDVRGPPYSLAVCARGGVPILQGATLLHSRSLAMQLYSHRHLALPILPLRSGMELSLSVLG